MNKFYSLPKILILLGLVINAFSGYTQVGFDNPNPHPSSLIDMTSKDKGLLIPRMTTVDRTNMLNPGKKVAHALLVFDINQNMFFVLDTIPEPDRWVALNPFQAPSKNGDITMSTTGNVGIGTTSLLKEKLEVNGKVKAQEFVGYGTIPTGGIIMWSGNPNNLPDGWKLCDGIEGRPNLKGRFIVGYDPDDADYNTVTSKTGPIYTDADGSSDGSNSVDAKNIKLLSSQSGLPAHEHQGITSYDGEHTHDVNSGGDRQLDAVPQIRVPASNSDFPGGPYSIDMKSAGFHSHSFTTFANQQKNATSSFENRPPFYVLAYIIRVK